MSGARKDGAGTTDATLTFDDAVRIVTEKRAEYEQAGDARACNVTDASLVALKAAKVRGQRTGDAQLLMTCVPCSNGLECVRTPRCGPGVSPLQQRTSEAVSGPTSAAPKRVEFWRIRPVEGGAWLYETKLANLVDLIESETSENHALVLEKTSLTEEEAANMGEFDGW
jgi:hypothetical protein